MATLIETEEAARRLARASASDLEFYNPDKVMQGIANDNLFAVLGDEIELRKANYKTRVTPELFAKNFFDRAIVDVIVRSKGHIVSKMW